MIYANVTVEPKDDFILERDRYSGKSTLYSGDFFMKFQDDQDLLTLYRVLESYIASDARLRALESEYPDEQLILNHEIRIGVEEDAAYA